jgi:hypothetical protein|nr:MAG TPA: hypothetical protein [Caudoviricetes sp.]
MDIEGVLKRFSFKQIFKGLRVGVVAITGKQLFFENETKIQKIDDNTVVAYFQGGRYKQTITADGTGNVRYNFKSVIEEVSE